MADVLFKLGNYDFSKNIIKDTYEVVKEPSYESWQDGNFHEHRVYVRDRIKGSFDLIFFGSTNSPYTSFLQKFNTYTSNRLTTCTVFLPSTCTTQQIQAYFYIEPVQHAYCDDGKIVNKVTLHFEEY